MGRLVIHCDSDQEPVLEASDPVPLPARAQVGVPGWLADRQGRRLRYLRLSVTDRCDLKCTYCMPAEGVPASPKAEILTLEELARVAAIFGRIGVRTVRLTGGEPLLRRGITELVQSIREQAGITDIAMTTNGTALAPLAAGLVQAGLQRLNVSLDSLRPERFAALTRGGELARVLAGIEAARCAGVAELKINCVVVRGENDDELPELVRWAWARDLTPRFIELMPLGEAAKLGLGRVVPVSEMRARLGALLGDGPGAHDRGRGPAGYVPARDGSSKSVGFIGAVTENFCERCNRVRVTAKGELRACLASPQGLALRERLRDGSSDEALAERVAEALFGKGSGHEFHVPGAESHFGVHMSRVGG